MLSREYPSLYIDGGWQEPDSKERFDIISPATGEKIGYVPAADNADIDRAKREAALKLGAAEAFDAADAGARKSIARASGGGVGAAIDFAGSDKSLPFAHAAVAKGGAAIVVGLIGGSFTLPVPMLPLRALTIMGSYVGSPGEAREMLDLVKAGKVAQIPVEVRADRRVRRRS